ncbi:putative HTH-type transcriptional regulator YfmP [Trichinella spiralis]|uniref:putative HTH-type transcriptional regulator YfmP n=1 Tax=Trichinella spiralis TaxID=6334 RepID=UPI0001EFDA89|nr:putative HTH-type transcriptional regulator YfmP [Trichinella spiralis]XP_003371060.1 putative HTH-type transcriptional regulator YfmP [Trichinella spiralis]
MSYVLYAAFFSSYQSSSLIVALNCDVEGRAVKLGKKERKKKIQQTKQNVNKFFDLLPPPGQTAPLDSEILQQMLEQSS